MNFEAGGLNALLSIQATEGSLMIIGAFLLLGTSINQLEERLKAKEFNAYSGLSLGLL